jgi:hypothetical protein
MDLLFLTTSLFFTAVALSVSVSYLAITAVVVMAQGIVSRLRHARPVSRRPGEVVHQALRITGRRWDQYRTAALLFVASSLLLVIFGRRNWWTDMSFGTYGAIAAAELFLLGFGVVKLIQLARYRGRLSNLLNTHITVAQRLVEAQLRGNRVYHAVPIGKTIIDNVVVGRNGIYTVNLFPPPNNQCDSVRAVAAGLIFQPGGLGCDLRKHQHQTTLLARALSRSVGSPITVLPVIVIPGCAIEPKSTEGLLLVSMESCTAFIGWKEPHAFLMDEDVEEINRWLSTQGFEKPPRSLQALADVLDAQIERPAMV